MKVTLIMIESLNGFIHSKHLENKPWWGTKEDISFFKQKTQEIGSMIFGHTTYLTLPKSMFTDRFGLIFVKEPERYRDQEHTNLKFFSGTPQEALDYLASIGKTSVVLGGGGTINGQFLAAGLVDEIYLTISPRLFGTGVKLFGDQVDFDVKLKLLEFNKLTEDELLLHYQVLN